MEAYSDNVPLDYTARSSRIFERKVYGRIPTVVLRNERARPLSHFTPSFKKFRKEFEVKNLLR